MRLCTKGEFNELLDAMPPEIQRSDLTTTVLRLKALRVKDIAHFDFISPPPANSMVFALNRLNALQAIDDEGNITVPLGERMARLLPLDPRLSKLLLLSLEMGCSLEALTIVAFLITLGESSLFTNDISGGSKVREEKIDSTISAFGAKEGANLIILLKFFEKFDLRML
jgi:ATP-dependent RNA helicase DHX8/PRP22